MCGEAHRLEHVELVGTTRRISADADGQTGRDHALGRRKAVAEAQVAAWVVGHGSPPVGHKADVVVVEPNSVRRPEPGAENDPQSGPVPAARKR